MNENFDLLGKVTHQFLLAECNWPGLSCFWEKLKIRLLNSTLFRHF